MSGTPASSQRAARNLVAALLLAAAGWAWRANPGEADAYSRALALTRASGYVALIGLCCALCVTPLARLWNRWQSGRRIAASRALRRAFGIGAALCGIVHALQALIGIPGVQSELWSSPRLRSGSTALLILVLLLLTSFPSVVARLRIRFWKELHRLAYVALPFGFLHALLAPFAPLATLLVLAAVALGIGLLRALPARRSDEQ